MGRGAGGGGRYGGGKIDKQSAENIVSGLSDRFGTSKVGVNTTDDWNIAANARDKDILINPDALNSDTFYDPRYSDGVSRNAKEVLIHEYGHVIRRDLLLDPKYLSQDMSKPSNYYAVGRTPEGSLGLRLWGISQREGYKISKYASKTDDEYFSEAFVLYNRGSRYWSRINPEVLQVFKNLDRKK